MLYHICDFPNNLFYFAFKKKKKRLSKPKKCSVHAILQLRNPPFSLYSLSLKLSISTPRQMI